MNAPVCEQLTLFREGFPASRSALRGSEEERETTVTSGRKCYELYGRSLPLGSLVRTCLESSIWHSTRCSLIWKVKDTPAKRLLFRLAVSMPRTSGNGFAFWPTPSVGAALCGGTGNFKTLKAMQEAGLITEDERRQLSQGNGGKTYPGLLEWLMGYEQAFTKLIPTPTANDYKGGNMTRIYNRGGVQTQALRTCGVHSPWENWSAEPDIPRVADGVPHRVDRIKCLGNAVVPHQFYPFFLFISEQLRKQEDKAT